MTEQANSDYDRVRAVIAMKFLPKQYEMVGEGRFADLEGETDKIVLLCEEVAQRNGFDVKIGLTSASLIERTILFTSERKSECAFIVYRHDEPGKSRVIGSEQFLEQVVLAVQPS